MFEKGPYEKYMLFRKFIRLTKHMFFEKVYMFLKKVYMFFEKVCMFLKKYICFLKKYVCFLKKYIFFEKAYIFFVRLLLVHRTSVDRVCNKKWRSRHLQASPAAEVVIDAPRHAEMRPPNVVFCARVD